MFETCTEDEHLIGRWTLPGMIAVAGGTVRHGDDTNLAALFRQGAQMLKKKELRLLCARAPSRLRLGAHPAAERAGRRLYGIHSHCQRGDQVGTWAPLLCFIGRPHLLERGTEPSAPPAPIGKLPISASPAPTIALVAPAAKSCLVFFCLSWTLHRHERPKTTAAQGAQDIQSVSKFSST